MLPRGTLHITRLRFIWEGVCHEIIRVRNFALTTVSVELVGAIRIRLRNIVDGAPNGVWTRHARVTNGWNATVSRRAAWGRMKWCARPSSRV